MPRRIPEKWDAHGEVNCGICEHYHYELVVSEYTAIGEGDETCAKRQKALHEGGNCRHWSKLRPQPTTNDETRE